MFKKFFETLKMKRLASQLRKPTGSAGHKVGIMMNKSNELLYNFTLDQMQLQPHETILEIGFGNGKFFDKIFSRSRHLAISGIDYSTAMVEEARKNNSESILDKKLFLQSGNSDHLPFDDNHFDKIFCINVIYFWDDVQKHLQEILRVLKLGGRLYVTIRSKESMQIMPFTKYNFTMYSESDWKQQINKSKLNFIQTAILDEPAFTIEDKSLHFQSLCIIAEKKC